MSGRANPRVRQEIVQKGQINLPFGDARHAPIAAEDQPRVIAAILAACLQGR